MIVIDLLDNRTGEKRVWMFDNKNNQMIVLELLQYPLERNSRRYDYWYNPIIS